jgi:hypothetical protein
MNRGHGDVVGTAEEVHTVTRRTQRRRLTRRHGETRREEKDDYPPHTLIRCHGGTLRDDYPPPTPSARCHGRTLRAADPPNSERYQLLGRVHN